MIKSEIPRRRGRTPAVSFPIRRTVVESGLDRKKVIEAGDAVSCLRCQKPFRVDSLTARLSDSSVDDMPILHCPSCGYAAAVLYYFDRVIGARPRRMRTPEDSAPRILTPEG